MHTCLNLPETQIFLTVLLLQIPTASKKRHKASRDFIESYKSVILTICSKLSGFTKCWESLKTEEVALYVVLPVLFSINCLSV